MFTTAKLSGQLQPVCSTRSLANQTSTHYFHLVHVGKSYPNPINKTKPNPRHNNNHNPTNPNCNSSATTPQPQPFYGPISGTTRVGQCQKRTSGLYGAKGRLTEADTLTIWVGATPSRLTSAQLRHPTILFYGPDALSAAQPTASKH